VIQYHLGRRIAYGFKILSPIPDDPHLHWTEMKNGVYKCVMRYDAYTIELVKSEKQGTKSALLVHLDGKYCFDWCKEIINQYNLAIHYARRAAVQFRLEISETGYPAKRPHIAFEEDLRALFIAASNTAEVKTREADEEPECRAWIDSSNGARELETNDPDYAYLYLMMPKTVDQIKDIVNRISRCTDSENFSDEVPEHILGEIMNQKKDKSKSPSVAHELELEVLTTAVEDFNAQVNEKLGTVTPTPITEEEFFNEVQGYDDLKKLLGRMVVSKESVHAVLVGPPASGKTMFLLSIQQKMEDVFFIDATNASGAGIVDKLFSRPNTKIIIVDEQEKMSVKDQNMLLGLLETGKLISTKVRKTAEMEFNGIKLFATSNHIDLLSKPLRSRLIELHLPEYNFEEFQDIVVKLANDRHDLDGEVGKKIAHVVWNDMKTKDVRDALQLSKLVTSEDDVEIVAKTISKYKAKTDDHDTK
jgi:Holliday junction resolvasome RuvABC ATP-dependent DNA helicase subunit